MTGVGAASAAHGAQSLSVEVRSVNHRWFKFSLRCPRALQSLEAQIEARAQSLLKRGAVSMTLSLSESAAAAGAHLDEALLRAWKEELLRCSTALHLPPREFSVLELAAMPGVLQQRGADADLSGDSGLKSAIMEAVDRALQELLHSRAVEGAALGAVLQRELDATLQWIAQIEPLTAAVPQQARDRLMARVMTLCESLPATLRPDARELAREVCFAAERSDVTEEMDRLREHCRQCGKILKSDAEHGKRLDFLLQEMLRETNTLGSKTPDAAAAHMIVELKCCIERMKEQVQNLE